MKFRLLGPLEIGPLEEPLIITGSQQRALLATLLLAAGHVVASLDLIAELWPKRPADDPPRNSLHALVARLRHILQTANTEATICRRPGGYILTVDPDDLDITHFHRLRATGACLANQDQPKALATYREALALWRGTALQDTAMGQRCKAAAANLNEARLHTLEQLADIHIGIGNPGHIVNDLQELAQLYPMRETLLARLMAALYGCGRSAEALHLYMEVRRRFSDELGMEPGEAMRKEYMRVIRHA